MKYVCYSVFFKIKKSYLNITAIVFNHEAFCTASDHGTTSNSLN